MVDSGRCAYTFIQSVSPVYCMARPSVIRNQCTCMGSGTPVGHSTNGSLGVTRHTMALRAAGRCSAVSHWMRPG